MARILLVARNAFRAVMSRRALYVWSAAVVLMFLRSAPAIFLRADDPRLRYIRANAIAGSLETWAVLCIGAAILLGAASIAGEITTKTIVTVIARPIHRWELMAGKWIGVTAFCLLSLAIGLALHVALARYLGIDIAGRTLAIAVAQTIAAIVLFGGFAVATSAFGSAPLAVSFTILLTFMPGLIQVLKEDPGPIRRRTGQVLGVMTPPGYDSLYRGVAWAPYPAAPNARVPRQFVEPPPVDYPLQRKNLAENMSFAGVYFLIGCAFFTRRDLKLS